ncbi:unnamed protein product [Rotaria sp. Silwood2]|nr:unnamed protein product [Rotaria sp. Silwood2]CAF3187129.1 unnamed protein product [Rotaria sp. Silwood2]CAF3360829.1 unnamed protein product [Rotaria sp. Silwood2]CAF3446093.1 unnamed protein product [Rotaria sp. Silwood2]CAF4337315.1 unnamed protein product [Rotaria sp. Silwood2]
MTHTHPNKVTFIVTQPNGFTARSTFFDKIAPSAEICSLVSCGKEIESGCILSTFDFNAEMILNIDEINVLAGVFLELSMAGSTSGFKFLSCIKLTVMSQLLFVGSGGGIMLSPGYAINSMSESYFISSTGAFIQVFNLSTGINIGM